MKKLILYAVGAIFLFVSCQNDELESDDSLVQDYDALMMQAKEAYKNYQSKTKTDWSQTSKSINANQVAREWTMKYSYATRFAFVPNTDDCAGFGSPTLELQIDGYGLGSLFGNFTFINRQCFPWDGISEGPTGPPLEAMRGVGTAANGDQWYFNRVYNEPCGDEGYFLQVWTIDGGSEGGRFERADGWLWLYGNPTSGDPSDPDTQEPFVGGGTFIY